MSTNIRVRFTKKMVEYTEKTGMFSSKKTKYPTLIVDLTFSDLYRAAIQQMDLGDAIEMMTYKKTQEEYRADLELERTLSDHKAEPARTLYLKAFILKNPHEIKAHYFHTLDSYIGQIKEALQNLDAIIQANLPGFDGKDEEEAFEL